MWLRRVGELIGAYKIEQTDIKIIWRNHRKHTLYEMNGMFNKMNTD